MQLCKTLLMVLPFRVTEFSSTGSPKKHETWKTTWELLTDILEIIKDLSIKLNM